MVRVRVRVRARVRIRVRIRVLTSQKSITRTRAVTSSSTALGTMARTRRDLRRARTSAMFAASVRKSSSLSTSDVHSRTTGPKSASLSKRATMLRIERRLAMSCFMRLATPRCCALTTTW